MDNYYVFIPNEVEEVINKLKEVNWLITNFDADITELYNPANYLHNVHTHSTSYILVPDRNIFSYILSSTTKNPSNDNYRNAIGLIIFAMFCEIQIEPGIAIYELLNCSFDNIEIALNELELFRTIDNYDNDKIYQYFKGNIDILPIERIPLKEREKIRNGLTKYQWLTEWKSLYLIILKIIDLSLDDKPNDSKVKELLHWMSHSFRFSLVGTFFAITLFSSKRISKMIKYKINVKRERNQVNINNMTWDLYYMNMFFRYWQNNDSSNKEYIFASNDNVIKHILKIAVLFNKTGDYNILKDYLLDHEVDNYKRISKDIKNNTNRVYMSDKWTSEYRDKLILELETKLL